MHYVRADRPSTTAEIPGEKGVTRARSFTSGRDLHPDRHCSLPPGTHAGPRTTTPSGGTSLYFVHRWARVGRSSWGKDIPQGRRRLPRCVHFRPAVPHHNWNEGEPRTEVHLEVGSRPGSAGNPAPMLEFTESDDAHGLPYCRRSHRARGHDADTRRRKMTVTPAARTRARHRGGAGRGPWSPRNSAHLCRRPCPRGQPVQALHTRMHSEPVCYLWLERFCSACRSVWRNSPSVRGSSSFLPGRRFPTGSGTAGCRSRAGT